MPQPAIAYFSNVSLHFGDTPALEHVSFDLRAGETVVIFGAAGAGKTMLIKTAAGLVKRTPKKKTEAPAYAEPGASGGSQPRSTGSSQRSPEEVRKMLSRYRSGLNKGRSGADSEKTDS